MEKTNVSMLIEPDSEEQGKAIFEKAENNGCNITMKYEKQFWGDSFGSFTDPFGIRWQINYSASQE